MPQHAGVGPVLSDPGVRIAAMVALYGAAVLATSTQPFRDATLRGLPGLGPLGYAVARASALAAVLLALVGWALLQEDRGVYVVGVPWRWALRSGQAAGLALIVAAVRSAIVREQAGGAGDPPSPVPWGTGPYALVRHPVASGALLVLWLTPQMTVNRLAFNAAFSVLLLAGSLLADRRRAALHGDAYRAYRRDVPWLVPRPGGPRPPGTP